MFQNSANAMFGAEPRKGPPLLVGGSPRTGAVGAAVLLGRRLSKPVRDASNAAARIAGVDAFLGERPQALSGGELRRAELALALVRRPRCLLAGE